MTTSLRRGNPGRRPRQRPGLPEPDPRLCERCERRNGRLDRWGSRWCRRCVPHLPDQSLMPICVRCNCIMPDANTTRSLCSDCLKRGSRK